MSQDTVQVDLRIADDQWRPLLAEHPDIIDRSVNAAADAIDQRGGLIDILLTSDAEMQQLNARWRGKDKPTDVLSFPSGEPQDQASARFLGDIAMGWQVCASDAERIGTDMQAHLAHLTIHGFLHLMGYDHEESAQADIMEALEVRILGTMGYSDPYARATSDETATTS